MLADILLDPTNRLLHGAAVDFSMFGTQPTVTVGPQREAADTGGFVTTARGATEDGSAARDMAPPARTIYAPQDDIEAVAIAYPAAASYDAQLPAAAQPTISTAYGDLVQHAVGSGSVSFTNVVLPSTDGARTIEESGPTASPGLTAPTLDVASGPPAPVDGFALGAVSASLVGPVLAATGTAADVAHGTIQAAVPVIDTALETVVATLDDALAPVAGSLTGTVETLIAELGDGPADAVANTIGTVQGTVGALDNLVGAVGGGLESTVGAVGGRLDSTVGAVGGGLDSTVGAVGGGLESTVGAVADTADDTLAAVTPAAVDIFAGSDPAAGVTTLVGMVASADVFDLADTVPTDTVDVGGSILDGLVLDGDAVSPLLGDLDHHGPDYHGGGLLDDLGHGLLGGGL